MSSLKAILWPDSKLSSFVISKHNLFPLYCSLSISDIYISVVSFAHHIAAKEYFLAIASTTVETNEPENELKPAIDLLEPIEQKYDIIFIGQS